MPPSPRLTKHTCWSWPGTTTLNREIHRLGKSDTDKPHVALGLGLTARHEGLSVGFATAAAFVHELMGVRDEKRLTAFRLLIIDVLGFVPLSKVGTELLLEVFNQRYK